MTDCSISRTHADIWPAAGQTKHVNLVNFPQRECWCFINSLHYISRTDILVFRKECCLVSRYLHFVHSFTKTKWVWRNRVIIRTGRNQTFIHSAVCLMTGPMPPPKRFLHTVRFKASSFRWEYPLLSLMSSSNFLRLLPLLLVTSISPFIFPSITCRIRQFLHSMWPIQLAFLNTTV